MTRMPRTLQSLAERPLLIGAVLIVLALCVRLAAVLLAGDRWANLGHAAAFFLDMLRAPIPRIAVENPIMLGHVRRLFDIPAPSQTIQPWQHGHPETKATCLWLRSLPRLQPTQVVDGRDARVHRDPPGPERWRNRSRTYPGIAAAMAEQWGSTEQGGAALRSDPL